MTQADGFSVDCDALEEIAGRAHAVAPDADAALTDVREAFANTISGAPGSQTAKVADAVHQIWGPWLQEKVEKIEEIARKLEETCADYRATDEGIGSGLDQVGNPPGIPGVPGGGYVPPHMDPDARPDGGGGSFEDVVPGGGWNPPGGAGGPPDAPVGIPGAPGGGYVPPHMDPEVLEDDSPGIPGVPGGGYVPPHMDPD